MRAIQLLPTIVIGLVIAGIVAVAGLKVIANFRSNVVDDLSDVSVSNESQTAVTTIVSPTYVTGGGILSGVSDIKINQSGTFLSVTVGTEANASTGYHGTGLITIAGNYSGNQTRLWYTYNAKDAILNATVASMEGTTEVTNQFATIGIIAAMVIILMLIGGLTAYFGLR